MDWSSGRSRKGGTCGRWLGITAYAMQRGIETQPLRRSFFCLFLFRLLPCSPSHTHTRTQGCKIKNTSHLFFACVSQLTTFIDHFSHHVQFVVCAYRASQCVFPLLSHAEPRMSVCRSHVCLYARRVCLYTRRVCLYARRVRVCTCTPGVCACTCTPVMYVVRQACVHVRVRAKRTKSLLQKMS